MDELALSLVVVGGLVVGLGLFSNVLNARLPLSAPVVALGVGVVLGPQVLDLLDVARWGDPHRIGLESAHLALAIGLMATALRLPPGLIWRERRSLAVLLGVVMPLMWAATALLVHLLLGLPLLLALLVGAILTPTDPIVASSIVTSETAVKHLPGRIRHQLSAESGANDGLAQLLVLLPVLLMAHPPSEAAGRWLGTVLLREIAGGAALGLAAGFAAGRALHWAEAREYVEKQSFLAQTVALALVTLGAAKLAGVNGVFAVFLAGVAFDLVVNGSERAEEADVQEAVNQFFTLPIFALIGLMLPIADWAQLGWRAAVLLAAVLLLRRLPWMVLFRPIIPMQHHRRDALFAGWFGPIGASALLYAMMAVERTGDITVWTISSLVIGGSIVAHGVTATPLTRWHARS